MSCGSNSHLDAGARPCERCALEDRRPGPRRSGSSGARVVVGADRSTGRRRAPLATGAHRGRHARPPGPLRRGLGGSAPRRAPRSSGTAASRPGGTRPTRRRPRGPGGHAASVPTDPVGWSRVRRSMAAQGGDDGLREAARGRRDPGAHQAPGRRRHHRAGGTRVAHRTPGHTPDHLCLFDRSTGLVLSGDHVLPTITPHISGLTTAADPLAQFFASLDRMRALGRAGRATGARPSVVDLDGRVEAIKHHHEERLDRLRAASRSSDGRRPS